MRTVMLALPLLLAACSGSGHTPDGKAPRDPNLAVLEKEVNSIFQAFLDSMVEGDAPAGYLMISDSFRSEWLYARMQDRDGLFREWRDGLPKTARTDLDLWFGFCKKHRKRLQRAERLPGSVASQTSLLKLWNDYFKIDQQAVKYQMQRTRIERVTVDGAGATVQVRNAAGRLELYSMVNEGNGWKVDGHSAGARY